MWLHALGKRQGNTWDRSTCLPQAHTLLHCEKKSEAAVGLGCMSLHCRRKLEHPEEKPCEVKSSLFVRPDITNCLDGLHGLTRATAPNPVKALEEDKEKLDKKIRRRRKPQEEHLNERFPFI